MKKTELVAASLAAACLVGALATCREAAAAGLYVSDRGIRPLGRGGAFVAGADDLGAIWYNPAGIVDSPSSVLLDGSWIHYTSTYTRRSLATSAQNGATYEQTFPSVKGTTPFLPIPTLAGSYRWGEDKQYAIAVGVFAPDAALIDYPLVQGNVAGPQRYSMVSLNGTILAEVGAWFSYKPIEQIRIGVGVQMLTGWLDNTVVFSACPQDNLVCAGQDPSYDAYTKLHASPIFAPSANAGVIFVPDKMVRIGISGQAPFVIDAPTTVDVRLPQAVVFDNAKQVGNSAHLHLELPPVVRAGVELRPLDHDELRIELAYVREFWSVEKSLDVTPDNLQLYNITGFPSPFGVNQISVPRGMQDSNSFRLGVEYKYDLMGTKLLARAGVSYETSSLPTSYVQPLTIDANKVQASIGGGMIVDKHLRLDWVISHTFQGDVNVSPYDAAVPLINPVKGNPTQTVAVNGGTYSTDLWIIGGGLEYRY